MTDSMIRHDTSQVTKVDIGTVRKVLKTIIQTTVHLIFHELFSVTFSEVKVKEIKAESIIHNE